MPIEVNTDMQEGFLRVNSLLYEFPPQLSVSSRRHRVTNYFQRNTYSPSETMVLDSQTGSTFVYGPDSYLTFAVQSVGAAAKKAWYETNPERFKKLYGPNYTLPAPSTTKE